jgi:hypothetical protein
MTELRYDFKVAPPFDSALGDSILLSFILNFIKLTFVYNEFFSASGLFYSNIPERLNKPTETYCWGG